MSMLEQSRQNYPRDLKVGDFIQTTSHFGDIFFEVTSCYEGGHITFICYEKYGSQPRKDWTFGRIRRHIPAELAVPVMVRKGQRFAATFGQYDPFYGFAPVGTPLRKKGD